MKFIDKDLDRIAVDRVCDIIDKNRDERINLIRGYKALSSKITKAVNQTERNVQKYVKDINKAMMEVKKC